MNAIIESYLQGVSTRKIEAVISHLGVSQISASYVSKVAQELDGKVTEFMERSVDSYISYLFVDASYFKVRDSVRYVSKSLLIVAGVRTDGYREILAARVADAEHELTWEGIFSDLKERGLTTVSSPSLRVTPESGLQPGKCSRVHGGRCTTFTSSGRFSEKFPGNTTRKLLRH